jgi:hypothetical protein
LIMALNSEVEGSCPSRNPCSSMLGILRAIDSIGESVVSVRSICEELLYLY